MAYLPNNRLYLFDIKHFIEVYQYLMDTLIYSVFDLKKHTSFQNDFNLVINYYNRIVDMDYVEQYYHDTSPLIQTEHQENYLTRMLKVFDLLVAEIDRRFYSFIDEDGNGDILFDYDTMYLYILDRRKQTYVPDSLYLAARQRENKSFTGTLS